MKDYSANYADRHMITGWVVADDEVKEVQAFYCTNGPDANDGHRNVLIDGVSHPTPNNDSAMYWSPEAGYSMNRDQYHATRDEAVAELRERLTRMRDYYVNALAALEA